MEHLSAFPIKNFHSEHTKLFLTHLPSPCQRGKGIFKCLSICFITSKCSRNSLSMGKTLPPAAWLRAREHLRSGKPSPDHFCLFYSKPLHEHAAIWKKGFFSRGKRSRILVPNAVYPVTRVLLGTAVTAHPQLWDRCLCTQGNHILSGMQFLGEPPMANGALMN